MKIFEQLASRRSFSEEECAVLEQVRRVAEEEVAPRAAALDRTGEFPWESLGAVNELGLNALFVPEAYGGAPMRFAVYLQCVRLLSAACASTGIIYATNFHGMKPLIEYGSEEQKRRLLPRIAEGGIGALAITEPDAGSDATGMKLRLRPEGDEIVVSGVKTFITSGDVADRILLFGKWSEIEDSRAAISALIFEKGTPGFEVMGLESKMGHRASSTATLSFEGARVPRANLLGEPGQGLEILLASLKPLAPEHRGPRAGHRGRGLRGHGRLWERARAVRAPGRRVPGQPVPAGGSGLGARPGGALARLRG